MALMIGLLVGLLSVSAAGAQTVTLVAPPAATVRQVVTEHTFAIALTVVGAPGGPRDYVGLFRVADGVRVDWRYLDDTKDTAKHRAMQTGPTAGTVRFAGLTPGDYAVRLYRNGSAAQVDLLRSELITVPRPSLEMLVRANQGAFEVNRTMGAERDVVSVKHTDGRETFVELDKTTGFNVVRAAPVP